MVIFTYNDYLDYISSSKIRKVINSQNKIKSIEKQEKIQYTKEEIINIINKFFKIKNLNIKKLKIYDKKENKILKIKKKQIYFLVKIQQKPNYNISYIILTECINFIEKWKKENKNYKKTPIIIPIVIYTGKEKWNINRKNKIRYTSFEENRTNLAYNIIDINKIKKI